MTTNDRRSLLTRDAAVVGAAAVTAISAAALSDANVKPREQRSTTRGTMKLPTREMAMCGHYLATGRAPVPHLAQAG